MNHGKNFPLYALAVLAGGGLAIWAGISPFFLLILLVCPLMMFFMMRSGMHGGHGEQDHSQHGQPGSAPTRPADLDGSHERIDRP